MAKGDKKKVNTAIDTQRTNQTAQQDKLRNQFQDQYNFYNTADQSLRNQIQSGYENFNLNDFMKSYGGGGGGGSVSGGIDPSKIDDFGKDPYAVYKRFSEGGGLTPEFWTGFNKSMGDMDTSIAGYKNFMDTGGFSEADLGNIRARGLAGNDAAYEAGRRQLQRSTALSGVGGGGNSPAAIAQMAREQAKSQGDQTVANEANIAQMVQQGKQFGTAGMGTTAAQQAGIRAQVEELNAQLKLSGAAGMTDIEKSRLEAELQNAQLNQSASSANASRADADMRFRAAMEMDRLGGMQNLYSSAPGATGQAGNFQLQAQDLAQSGNINLINSQIANRSGGFMDVLKSLGGGIGSGLSRIFGGGSNQPLKTGTGTPAGVTDYSNADQFGQFNGSMPSNNIFLGNQDAEMQKRWGGNTFNPRMSPNIYGR